MKRRIIATSSDSKHSSKYVLKVKSSKDGYNYQGCGGRSLVKLESDNLDIFDTFEEAEAATKDYKNPSRVKIVQLASRINRPTPVKAAAGTTKGQEAFEEAISNLEENFEFVIQGLEKLSREGGEGPSQSLQLVLECNSAIEQITQKIAGVIRE